MAPSTAEGSRLFSRVAIVGVGLIGGSLGMALRQRRLAAEVVGVGRNAVNLTRACDLGAIDRFDIEFGTGVADADLVVLATPIPQILQDLARLGPLLRPDAIVTDVGSTKAEIVAAGEASLPTAFVGSHPMAGSERSGVEAARPDLFEEATWVLTPTDRTPPEHVRHVRTLAQHVGAHTVDLSPDSHDRVVAVTSHLPHVLAYALASLAGKRATEEPRLYDLAAGSFASATRVAFSSPDLWRDIALSNAPALAEAIRAYQDLLANALGALESGDSEGLLAAFLSGYNARRQTEIL
jgi:prephenate dehydrogenase